MSTLEVTLVFSLGVVCLAFLGIGIGVLTRRSAIRGSCGGLMAQTESEHCGICGQSVGSCQEEERQ